MCESSREHSCVYIVGIIQYWERVLILVLLSSDPKISSQNFLVSRKFWASNFPRLGESEPKFPEEILGEEILPENFLVRDVFFPKKFLTPPTPKFPGKISS